MSLAAPPRASSLSQPNTVTEIRYNSRNSTAHDHSMITRCSGTPGHIRIESFGTVHGPTSWPAAWPLRGPCRPRNAATLNAAAHAAGAGGRPLLTDVVARVLITVVYPMSTSPLAPCPPGRSISGLETDPVPAASKILRRNPWRNIRIFLFELLKGNILLEI
jgi:hypothetical protein